MAIGLRRKVRLDSWRANQKTTRRDNGGDKRKERARRAGRMIAVIKAAGSRAGVPPAAQSWASAQLDKAWRQVTEADLKALVAG